MATARAMLERRRSSRVPVRIPLKVFDTAQGERAETPAETIEVSRCGALVRTHVAPRLGSYVEILHSVSRELREFRVVRVARAGNGVFHLGVEIAHPAQSFWGIRLPGE